MTPSVSVMMTVFNARPYLPEAVESILAQTFGDFELIIIDDGSSDGSGEILERYAQADSRIRLVRRENRGIGASRNEVLALARGEFLAVMDADDVSMPDRFERQIDFLRANPAVVCVGGAVVVIDERGRKLTVLQSPGADETIQKVMLKGHPSFCHPSVMMRLSVARAIGGYRAEFDPAEDIDLFLRLGERGQLANLPVVVLKYREHSKSASQRHQEVQLKNVTRASNEACDRRGIPRQADLAIAPRRPGADRWSRHTWALRNGWWAFGSGERKTAAHYAAVAIRLVPWRQEGWQLLACILLKRPTNGAA